MATFKIEVILSRFMTNEFKPADPGTNVISETKKTQKKKNSTCPLVFAVLYAFMHTYLHATLLFSD